MEEEKILKNAIHCIKMGADLAVCEDCDLYPCDHTVIEDMARVAIKALEKQIPKRVVCKGDDESDDVHCPCCNEYIGSNETVWDWFYYNGEKNMHCTYCGQAMTWE